MILETTKGPIDDSALRHERTDEAAPCGRIVEDKWYLCDELVKCDVTVLAAPFVIGTGTGRLFGGLFT